MTEPKTFYGLDGWELYHESIEDAVSQVLYEAPNSRDFDRDTLWPIVLDIYKPMELPAVEAMAKDMLSRALDDLDEEFGPLDDSTDETETMQKAALGFAATIRREYKVWRCIPTGGSVVCTKEEWGYLDD